MKILFNTYSMAFQRPGGGEQILLKSYEELKKRNIHVELFDPWCTKVEDFDIVHHFSLLEWQKFKDYKDFGAKVVVTPTAWPTVDFKTIIKEKAKTLFYQKLGPQRAPETLSYYQRYVDLFLPTTTIESELIQKRYQIPAEKCTTLANGVVAPKKVPKEENQFLRDYLKDHHDLENLIVFSGSIRPNKNVDLLIRTCIEMELPLIIMGAASGAHEDYERKCRELSKNSKSPIIWTGHIEHGSLTYNEIYSLARCVCIPSDFETFCLAAAEASSIGIPVVIPSSGGTTAIFGDSATYLNEYTTAALGSALAHALAIPENRNLKLAKDLREKYGWDKICEELLSHYKSIRSR